MRALIFIIALALSSCSLTIEDREAIRETGMNLATLAVEALQIVGVTPGEVDPKILQYANAGCALLEASSPTIVAVINKIVDSHNAELPADDQTDRTTVAEFTAGLEAICIIINRVFEAAPSDEA